MNVCKIINIIHQNIKGTKIMEEYHKIYYKCTTDVTNTLLKYEMPS